MFDIEYLKKTIFALFTIDSPSGYTSKATEFIRKEVNELGYASSYNNKGNLIVEIPGNDGVVYGLGCHVDTLGLMVRSIENNGMLAFEKIGGPILPTLDGEYCKVLTKEGKIYTGTILSKSPSSHVYPDAKTRVRDEENMEIRLDEVIYTKEDTKKLGIQTGDYIFIDPKTTITDSGFIKSRFLDDKISCCLILCLLKYFKENHIVPNHTYKIIFSTYEEVGHGCASIDQDIIQFLSVDMGCIGLDLNCTEQEVSICVKDSSGPYDYQIVLELMQLSKENNINYAADIYPKYSSDASAALRGGNNIRAGLIGPGIHASHGMERTHIDGVLNTMKLLYLYMTKTA